MPIRTYCPTCRTDYTLADNLAGKTVRCKKCNETFPVRSPKASAKVEVEQIQTQANGPKRSSARTEDEPSTARRRNRSEEVDVRRLHAPSSRGLVIGLVACAVGLLLVLVGGVVVAVFVFADQSDNPPPDLRTDANAPRPNFGPPNARQEADDGRPRIGFPEAPPESALLHIDGVVDENTREAISEKLDALGRESGHHPMHSQHEGNRMTVLVMPVRDVQAFSKKLDFGTVKSVNGRTITLTARKAEGPAPNADSLTKTLHQLKSSDVFKRHDALRKLKGTLPDDKRRAEVVKALEPLLNNDDHFTRHWAIEALGIWGNKDAVPLLLNAMREEDNRRDAIKALGRLKDERAAVPLAERLDEFFDRHEAEEALKAMGPIAEKAVLARLNHHDWQVRMTVCDILGAIGTKQSLPPLEKVVAAGKDPFSGQNHIVAKKAESAIQAIKARQ